MKLTTAILLASSLVASAQYATDPFTATIGEVNDGLNQTKPVTPWGLANWSGGGGGSNPNNITNTSVSFVSGSDSLGYGKIGFYDGAAGITNTIESPDGGFVLRSGNKNVSIVGDSIIGNMIGNGSGLTNLTLTPWTSDIDGGGFTLTNFSAQFNDGYGATFEDGSNARFKGGASGGSFAYFVSNSYAQFSDQSYAQFNAGSSLIVDAGVAVSGLLKPIGNGSGLTNLSASSIVGTVPLATTVTGSQSNLIATALQPTSTLQSSNVSGTLPQYPTVQIATNAPSNGLVLTATGTDRAWKADVDNYVANTNGTAYGGITILSTNAGNFVILTNFQAGAEGELIVGVAGIGTNTFTFFPSGNAAFNGKMSSGSFGVNNGTNFIVSTNGNGVFGGVAITNGAYTGTGSISIVGQAITCANVNGAAIIGSNFRAASGGAMSINLATSPSTTISGTNLFVQGATYFTNGIATYGPSTFNNGFSKILTNATATSFMTVSCPTNSRTCVIFDYSVNSNNNGATNGVHSGKSVFHFINNNGAISASLNEVTQEEFTLVGIGAGGFTDNWTTNSNTSTNLNLNLAFNYTSTSGASLTNHMLRIVSLQNLSTNAVTFIP